MSKTFTAEELLSFEPVKTEPKVYSADELLAFQPLEEDLQTRVASGKTTIEQDEQDLAQAGNRQFIPDTIKKDAPTKPSTLQFSAYKIADKASFGTVSKIVKNVSGISEEDLKATLDQVGEGKEVVGFLSDIAGYALNPLGRVVRAGTAGTGLAKMTISNVAEVLGVEGGAAAGDVIETFIKSPTDVKEEIKKQLGSLTQEGVAAGVGTVAVAGLIAPFKHGAKLAKPLLSKVANFAKKNLGDDAKLLIENADQLAKISPEELPKQTAQLLEKGKNGLRKYLQTSDAPAKAKIVAQELHDSIDQKIVSLLDNVEDPKTSIKALASLADEINVAQDGLSQRYGQALDELYTLTKGKKADISEPIQNFLRVFELEGSVQKTASGYKLTGKDTQFRKGIEALNELSKIKTASHKQIGEMLKMLQPAFRDSLPSEVKSQAEFAYSQLKRAFTDAGTWGDEAAFLSESLATEYSAAKGAFSALKGSLSKAKGGIKAMTSNEDNFISHITKVAKNLDKAQASIDIIKGSNAFSGTVPPALQKSVATSLKAARSAVDFQKARDIGNARKSLKKLFAGKMDLTKSDEIIRDALAKYSDAESLAKDFEIQYKALPAIQKALVNPFSKEGRTTASKWAESYAKELGPEITKTVNAMAKYNRLSGVTADTLSSNDLQKALLDVASPKDVLGLKLMLEFAPGIDKLAKDAELVKALEKVKPSITRSLIGKNLQEEIVVGAVASVLPGPQWPLMAILAAYNIASDPTGLYLAAEKLSQKELNKLQKSGILNAGRIASLLADEVLGTE